MRLRRHMIAASAALAGVACSAMAAAALTLPLLSVVTIPFGAPLASGTRAPASGPWSLAPGEYYSEISAGTYQTGSAFDDNGDRATYGGEVQEREFRSYTELGWKQHTSLQLSLPFVTHTETPFGGAPLSNTGLGNFAVGVRHALVGGPEAIALQFGWEAPAGYNPRLSPALGDGHQALSAGLRMGGPLYRAGFWQGGVGYRYDFLAAGVRKQGNTASATERDWADHLTLELGLAIPAGRMMVSGLYAGDLALQTGHAIKSTSHSAGPRFTFHVDPRVDFFAGSWHTPSGKNSLHLDRYYVGVAWKSTKLNRLQGLLGSDKRP